MSKMTRGWTTAVVVLASMGLALAAQSPQQPPQGRGGAPGGTQGAGGRSGPPPGRGGAVMGGGPSDMPTVDAAAADRGKGVYAAQCIDCHGTQVRGGDKGANLIRSLVVLKDRYGSELGPFLRKGHAMQGGTATVLTDAQVTDLSHFLRQRVNDSLRGSPIFKAGNVLTGNATAGAEYFKGAGGCQSCHNSTSSNLAGIASRFAPVDLQQRFLFPRTGGRGRGGVVSNPITVTVTPPAGAPVSGVLVTMDDFGVALRDAAGAYHSFTRTPALKIVKTDPLAAHIALLDTITDTQLHDIVAYLETMK